MALSLQETGILVQLKAVQEKAHFSVAGPITSHGWDDDTKKYVTQIANAAAAKAIEGTLQVFDAEGFFTKTENVSGTVGIVDVIHQEMAEEWVAAINS